MMFVGIHFGIVMKKLINLNQMSNATDILGHPRGLFVCFATEMWERFSYYGMRALLIFYLTKHWEFSDATSYIIYAAYTSLVYIMPVFGGLLADRILGSRKAVTYGAILLVLGHLGMTIETNVQIFYLSLALIISGVGFLKPNISTMVGALYEQDDPRRDAGFTIFYMGINIGAFTASLLCGYLGETYGWSYGFGAAGIGMLLGLIIFLWGQKYLDGNAEPPSDLHKKVLFLNLPFFWRPYNTKDPSGTLRFSLGASYETLAYLSGILMVLISWFLIQNQDIVGSLLGGIGILCIGFWLFYAFIKLDPIERDRLLTVGFLIFFSLLFWALFEQAGSSLNVLTDRGVDRSIFGWNVPASMFQSLNAMFIFILAPFFSMLWISLAKKGLEPAGPIKFGIALLFVGFGFLVLVFGMSISPNLTPVAWIILIYLLHTIGELCISPIGLWFFASAAGNFVAGLIARATSADGINVANNTFSIDQKAAFMDVYYNVGIFAVIIGVFVLLISPLMIKRMHGIK